MSNCLSHSNEVCSHGSPPRDGRARRVGRCCVAPGSSAHQAPPKKRRGACTQHRYIGRASCTKTAQRLLCRSRASLPVKSWRGSPCPALLAQPCLLGHGQGTPVPTGDPAGGEGSEQQLHCRKGTFNKLEHSHRSFAGCHQIIPRADLVFYQTTEATASAKPCCHCTSTEWLPRCVPASKRD